MNVNAGAIERLKAIHNFVEIVLMAFTRAIYLPEFASPAFLVTAVVWFLISYFGTKEGMYSGFFSAHKRLVILGGICSGIFWIIWVLDSASWGLGICGYPSWGYCNY